MSGFGYNVLGFGSFSAGGITPAFFFTSIGLAANQWLHGIGIDSNDNIVVSGMDFRGHQSGRDGGTAFGVNRDGTVKWQWYFDHAYAGNTRMLNVEFDTNDDCYISGMSYGSPAGMAGTSTLGDILLFKMDGAGGVTWGRVFGTNKNDFYDYANEKMGLAIGPQNHIYVGYQSQGGAPVSHVASNFGPIGTDGHMTNGVNTGMKFEFTGGGGTVVATANHINASNDVMILMREESNPNGSNILLSRSADASDRTADYWNGGFNHSSAPNSYNYTGFDLQTDSNENIYIVGSTNDSSDDSDCFMIIKIADDDSFSNVAVTLDKCLTGMGASRFQGIHIDGDDNIYACGYGTGTSGKNGGNLMGVLCKFDTDLALQWSVTFTHGGNAPSRCNAVTVDSDGHPCVTGYFTSVDTKIGVDTTIDGFVARLASDASSNGTSGDITVESTPTLTVEDMDLQRWDDSSGSQALWPVNSISDPTAGDTFTGNAGNTTIGWKYAGPGGAFQWEGDGSDGDSQGLAEEDYTITTEDGL